MRVPFWWYSGYKNQIFTQDTSSLIRLYDGGVLTQWTTSSPVTPPHQVLASTANLRESALFLAKSDTSPALQKRLLVGFWALLGLHSVSCIEVDPSDSVLAKHGAVLVLAVLAFVSRQTVAPEDNMAPPMRLLLRCRSLFVKIAHTMPTTIWWDYYRLDCSYFSPVRRRIVMTIQAPLASLQKKSRVLAISNVTSWASCECNLLSFILAFMENKPLEGVPQVF
ncbi:hypothetical protein C8J57DRAFT_1224130 [Mycena rebaudengoi]|nr:hypothetical protein C8J57DRAFT_1224130 [Mycena rebaudengoi]